MIISINAFFVCMLLRFAVETPYQMQLKNLTFGGGGGSSRLRQVVQWKLLTKYNSKTTSSFFLFFQEYLDTQNGLNKYCRSYHSYIGKIEIRKNVLNSQLVSYLLTRTLKFKILTPIHLNFHVN